MEREEWSISLIALLVTLVLHGALCWFISSDYLTRETPVTSRCEVEYEAPSERKLITVVVQTPSKPLRETSTEAAQSQRAAQSDPDPSSTDPIPTVKGESPRYHAVVEPSQRREGKPLKELQEGVGVPMPRPTLSAISSPLKQSDQRAGSTGLEAEDARFSQFGVYFQRMSEVISMQWHLLCSQMSASLYETRSVVVVQFYLNSEGGVDDLAVQFTSAGETATVLVKDAILSCAPFGMWDEEMLARLGENSQKFTMEFHYR